MARYAMRQRAHDRPGLRITGVGKGQAYLGHRNIQNTTPYTVLAPIARDCTKSRLGGKL
jgi:hypothetical protein